MSGSETLREGHVEEVGATLSDLDELRGTTSKSKLGLTPTPHVISLSAQEFS